MRKISGALLRLSVMLKSRDKFSHEVEIVFSQKKSIDLIRKLVTDIKKDILLVTISIANHLKNTCENLGVGKRMNTTIISYKNVIR